VLCCPCRIAAKQAEQASNGSSNVVCCGDPSLKHFLGLHLHGSGDTYGNPATVHCLAVTHKTYFSMQQHPWCKCSNIDQQQKQSCRTPS
jgi:hypothetical protein